MWPHFIKKLDRYGEFREIGCLILFVGLYVLSLNTEYDHRAGWKFRDRPYSGNIVPVTKYQALSMIREGRIRSYGMLWGRVVMRGEPGKWYSLIFRGNEDVVRKLAQHANFVNYDDSDGLDELIPPFFSPAQTGYRR